MQKIGIMGGTFNPIHNGHLALAERDCIDFELDKVLFVTAKNPPHKQGQDILHSELRHKMVTMATENYKKFEPYDFEIKNKQISYTLRTLVQLKKEYENAKLYLIIGADSFHNLPAWYKVRSLLELCEIIVYDREGYDFEVDFENMKKEYYIHAHFLKAPKINISSSMLREKIENDESISGLVPSGVYNFIERNKLYRPESGSYERKIKRRLSEKRFAHTNGVMSKAVYLAKLYGVSPARAKVAALFHDCAKEIPGKEMLQKCIDYDVELDEYEKQLPQLIHAKLGAKVAEYEFKIVDRGVLEAIKWHTIGRVGMTTLEKIIFISDMIEPTRNFKEKKRLNEIARQDLNKAMLECVRATVKYNVDNSRQVHPSAYELIDWLKTLPPLLPKNGEDEN